MKRFIIALACLALWPGGPGNAQSSQEGAALFDAHCAVCHGTEAGGDGPLAPALLLQPSDLRRLAARNEGVFPVVRVISRIDGRDPLVSHGSPMPVFGPFFDGDDTPVKAETGQPIMTSRPIVDLVAYLEGVQE